MRKISKEGRLPDVLNEGDQIEASVSSQTYIDGDQTWISYKLSSKLQEDETFDDAHRRVMNGIKAGFEGSVTEVVEMIQKMGE